jgi:hypothetical protein
MTVTAVNGLAEETVGLRETARTRDASYRVRVESL